MAEVAGQSSNPELLALIKRHMPSADDDSTTAWCGIFMGELFDQLGLEKPKGYMAARSWLNIGKPVGLDDAQPGDIVIFKRGTSTWQGHVGIFTRINDPKYISVFGGNQSNRVGHSNYAIADLLGVRRL